MSAPNSKRPCSGVEYARLLALTGWIAESRDSLLGAVQVLNLRERAAAKWFRVEVATTRGARVRLLVKPTQATTDLLAAAKALCENEGGVKRSPNAQRLLDILSGDFHGAGDTGAKR